MEGTQCSRTIIAMESIFRITIFLLPFIVCLLTFYWLARKALQLAGTAGKVLMLAVVAGGVGFTIYQLVLSAGKMFSDHGFNFKVIFINIWFFVAAAIIHAFASPEKS